MDRNVDPYHHTPPQQQNHLQMEKKNKKKQGATDESVNGCMKNLANNV